MGVYVYSKLHWKIHIQLLRCKLFKIISVFHKFKNKLNDSALLIIFESLCMSCMHKRYEHVGVIDKSI